MLLLDSPKLLKTLIIENPEIYTFESSDDNEVTKCELSIDTRVPRQLLPQALLIQSQPQMLAQVS